MTKRWLSLLLVLMLAIPTFGMSAMAATTTTSTHPEIRLNADGKVVITASQTGASIKYNYGLSTTTVADPTPTSGTDYTAPFTISAAGTYTIKAVEYGIGLDTRVDSDNIDIVVKATGITITPDSPSITGHGTLTLTAAVMPTGAAQEVYWFATENGKDEKEVSTTEPVSDHIKVKEKTFKKLVIESDGTTENVGITAKVIKGKGTTSEEVIVSSTKILSVTAVKAEGISAPVSLSVAKGEKIEFKASVLPSNVTYRVDALSASRGDKPSGSIADIIDVSAVVNPANKYEYIVTVTGLTTGTAGLTQNVILRSTEIGKTVAVPVTLTETSKVAPTPELSKADGTVFTSGKFTDFAVVVSSAADTSNATLKYTDNNGATWKDVPQVDNVYQITPFSTTEYNKSKTYMFQNVKTETKVYDADSEIVTATYTSKVEANSISTTIAPTDAVIIGTSTALVTATLTSDVTNINVKDNTVKFTSSNTGVATVAYTDSTKLKGTVKGVAAGSAVITVTSGDGKVSKDVTVYVKNNSVDYVVICDKQGNPITDVGLNAGEIKTITAKTYDKYDNLATNQSVTWSVEQAGEYIKIEDGKITALAAGNAVVKATSVDGAKTETVNVYVKAASGALENPVISPVTNSVPLKVKSQPITITYPVATETGVVLYYTTDGTDPTLDSKVYDAANNPSITTTSTVKAMAYKFGKTPAYKSELITLAVPATAVKLDKKSATVAVGGTLNFSATVTPDTATDKSVTWSVLGTDGQATTLAEFKDPTKGVLTASTTIGKVVVTGTVTTFDSNGTTTVTDTCVVSITAKPLASLVLTPETLSLNEGYSEILSYVGAESKAASKATIVWTSSDPTIADFDVNYTHTDSATKGSNKIVANSNGKAGTTTITVSVDGSIATCVVTVAKDPETAPNYPGQVTFTKGATTFNVEAGKSTQLVLGKLSPKSGETLDQAFYYGQFGLKLNNGEIITKYIGVFPTCAAQVKSDGTVVIDIPDVGKDSVVFDYEVTYKAFDIAGKKEFLPGADFIKDKAVNGNKLVVTAAPADEIKFEGGLLEDIIGVASEIDKTVTLGTVTNFADLKTKGYTLTVKASEADAAFTPAIDDKGVVTLAVKAPKAGEYSVTVTISGTKGADALKDVVTGAQKVTATELGIKVENAIIGKVEMIETETWSENVAQVTNLAVLDAAKYVVSVEPYVTVIDNGVATTVVKDWTAAIDALGNITLTATTPAPGTYEASVKVMAATADAVPVKLADVNTTAIPFTVTEEATDGDIVVASGLYAYNAKGELCLAKSQLTGVKFVLTNGRTATWKTNNKVIAISGDGSATFKPNKGSKAVVTATYTDKDGATVIVHQTVRLVKVVNTFKFEEKIGSKKWKTFKGASVDVDVSGTPIIKIKLLGKHGPTTSIMWNALASVSGEEIIKVNEYGNICVIAPQKIGTCQLMVSDFAGNSTLLTVNVVADLKVVDDEPQTAKVSDFIEIG